MKKSIANLFCLVYLTTVASAQVERVEPPFWWSSMPVNKIQLQLYGDGIGQYRASVSYEGVSIERQIAVDSTNYLFLYLAIDPAAKAGEFNLVLQNDDGDEIRHPYRLLPRDSADDRNQGFDASDLIYLMMPDRFANGDPANDAIAGMLEAANRSDPTKRQGGDLRGISDHLDYVSDLGMTAIWFTPVFENDMAPSYGAYHGYAATDLYRTDRRLGSNEEFRALVRAAHAKGLKVIMDMIHNHIGINHWWMADPPTEDWIHELETYGITNFRGPVPADPYASQADRERLVKGWFVPEMPDLNQRNMLLADYLIQNTLWWIEYSGIDGIRMDTYIYPYRDYMARWAKEVLEAYPTFNIIGEAWVETVAHEAFWQFDPPGMDDGYNSHLPSVTDFPFCMAIRKALTEEPGWETGLNRLYYLFAQDALYADANLNVIFLDNHDMGRIFEQLNRDEDLFKMAYAFLITSRGIPQVYYGTELMLGHEDRGGDDEAWRQTMPGGWSGDDRSVFTLSGRTDSENNMFDYVRRLNKWRAQSEAVHRGRLTHFIPEENVYVYFRTLESEAVMVVMNRNEEQVSLDTRRFKEVLQKFASATDVATGVRHEINESLPVAGKTSLILELRPAPESP